MITKDPQRIRGFLYVIMGAADMAGRRRAMSRSFSCREDFCAMALTTLRDHARLRRNGA
jgi:hypothetical protein